MSLAYLDMENGFCRCCLNEGNLKSLGDTFFVNEDEVEVYSLMLKECFDVTILQVKGMYSETTYSICENCIHMLREASFFKKMIIQSEIKFHDFYSKKFSKEMKSIKVELDEVIIPEDHDKDDPMEMEDDKMNVHIDDDVFHYPESDEDKKTTVELKIEHEPATTKKPQIVVKKDADLYMSKLRKRKEPVAKPQKKPQPQKTSAPETQPKPSSQSKMKPRKEKIPTADLTEHYKVIINDKTGENQYFCPKCRLFLRSKIIAEKHILNVHLKEQLKNNEKDKYYCDICSKYYSCKANLRNHIKRVHLLSSCKICGEKYSFIKLKYHMHEAHGAPIPTCGICGLKAYKESIVRSHQRKVHMKEKNVSCPSCDLMFFNGTDLNKHFVKHTNVRDFQCEFCHKKFRRQSTLALHWKIHTGRIPTADLTEHYKIIINERTGKNQYFCPKCQLFLRSKNTIENHILSRHLKNSEKSLVKEYYCDICAKYFSTKARLRTHNKMLHLMISCKICEEKISYPKLPYHMHEAHGAPIPTCGICGFKTHREVVLISHQRRVHMKEKNVSCPSCDLKFFDTSHLNRHLVKHRNARNYECEFCHKKFQRRRNMLLHVKIHTGEKDKICSICDAAFVQKASLNYHMVKHHPEVV